MENKEIANNGNGASNNQALVAFELKPQGLEAFDATQKMFRKFVRSQLRDGTDFGKIPGTSKPSLWKSGAEKLINYHRLGSRIIDSKETIDPVKNWAMFTYRIEIFHLATGKPIAQCEGSANSLERKYQRLPLGDVLNTLQKMAQKRAYVGAAIQATNASDFFTQDMEDIDITPTANEQNQWGSGYQRVEEAKTGASVHSSPGVPNSYQTNVAPQPSGDSPTDKQVKRFWAMGGKTGAGLSTAELKAILQSKWNVDSPYMLTRNQYNEACAYLETLKKEPMAEDIPF